MNKAVDPLMNPWHPMTNARDLKTLGKVNKKWLEEEIADVEAGLKLVKERFGLDQDFIQERAARKVVGLRVWHEMA